jgi:protein involved in polysaccharide export with SLBB domain
MATRSLLLLAVGIVGLVFVAGCDTNRFLDPSMVVQQPNQSPIRPIEIGMSAADYGGETYPNSSPPTDEDLKFRAEDYVIGPNDVLEVRIMDLFEPGVEYPLQRQVSASGYIDLPLVQRVKADGLTKDQVHDAIVRAYSPDIIRDPIVTVTVMAERQNIFSVIGGVARPGPYNLTRKDMTLLEAVAACGGATQTIPYIYVIRLSRPARTDASGNVEPQAQPAPAPSAALTPGAALPPAVVPTLPTLPSMPSEELPPAVVPDMPAITPPAPAVTPSSAQAGELEGLLPGSPASPAKAASAPASQPVPQPAVMPMLADNAPAGSLATAPASQPAQDSDLSDLSTDVKWVFSPSSGRFVPVSKSNTIPSQPTERIAGYKSPEPEATSAPATNQDPFGWGAVSKTDTSRVIAINFSELVKGNPRMNIVIRDNDVIQVPMIDQGEFYMQGEVNRPGVYSLAGRRVTVKMAIAAAGNLGPMAWPKNSILIRRLSGNQEQTFPLDIEAIYHGQANDVFLKPDDIIAIGQNAASPFLLVLRNAFRVTYGFGFIYDRNFSDPLDSGGGYDSSRFTDW